MNLEKYKSSLDVVVRFVTGEIEGSELQKALESQQMEEMLGMFQNDRYPARTNHFRRLMCQDRTSLGGLLNSQGILEDFLEKAEISVEPSKRYSDAYDLILTAMPSYLDPPLEFITSLMPTETGMSKKGKARILKQRLSDLFRCTSKPPKWVQSPEWPIVDGVPLVFIGQLSLDLPEVFHDTGQVFVFFCQSNGEFHTITQMH